MPSRNPEVKRRAQERYRNSAEGKLRRAASKKAWDQNNKDKKAVHDKKWRQTAAYKATVASKMQARRARRKAWLRDIKSQLSCVQCGYDKHPAALQFHHHNDDKIDSVTYLVLTANASWEKVIAEISKCVVLCANCHAILHDEEHENVASGRDKLNTRDRLPSSKKRLRPSSTNAPSRVKGEA